MFQGDIGTEDVDLVSWNGATGRIGRAHPDAHDRPVVGQQALTIPVVLRKKHHTARRSRPHQTRYISVAVGNEHTAIVTLPSVPQLEAPTARRVVAPLTPR